MECKQGISVGQTVGIGIGEPSDVEGDGTQNGRDGNQEEASLEETEVVLLEEKRNGHGDDCDVHEDVTQRRGLYRLQKRDWHVFALINNAVC